MLFFRQIAEFSMFLGSLVAIVTPMRPDGRVDFEAWARLVDFHLENGTNGIVVGGTTGESATLRDSELRELTERACEQVRRRIRGDLCGWRDLCVRPRPCLRSARCRAYAANLACAASAAAAAAFRAASIVIRVPAAPALA